MEGDASAGVTRSRWDEKLRGSPLAAERRSASGMQSALAARCNCHQPWTSSTINQGQYVRYVKDLLKWLLSSTTSPVSSATHTGDAGRIFYEVRITEDQV